MKKSYLRSFVWGFLVAFSLFSYLYLNSIPVEDYQEYVVEHSVELNKEDVEKPEVFLPNIALAKKIIELTKLIFH